MNSDNTNNIPYDTPPPWLEKILRELQELREENARLKDEIARLKKQKKRPKIAAPPIEKPKRVKNDTEESKKNPPKGRRKARKETRVIEPSHVPPGSKFKGYKEYTVQDVSVQATQITFKCKVYVTPEGKLVRGEVPEEYSNGHFGPELIAHCLQLYHGGGMTQPGLLEYLIEQGVEISAGQLHHILAGDTEAFTKEMDGVLRTGIKASPFLQTDDTGARHRGNNGVSTCISSPYFTYFQSTGSKSRLNFLSILRGSHKNHILDEGALIYASDHGISKLALEKLDDVLDKVSARRFPDCEALKAFLKSLQIFMEKDVRILAEATALSAAIRHGLPEGLPIVADAAPQFRLWATHGLCWVHEERHYRKLIPVTEHERNELAKIQGQIWELYAGLKEFGTKPSLDLKRHLITLFEKAFKRSGVSTALDKLLKKTYSRKQGLLQVLEHPYLPLHNNDCERDIREYVKRRKVSGGTRSDVGRCARDTFLSLKKTCLKLGVSFFAYIRDRVSNLGQIPPLAGVLRSKARAGPYVILTPVEF